MAVCRKRSTTSVPARLSISYLIGSPPIGTSTITLTSSGGWWPMEMASRFMANRLQRKTGGHTGRRFLLPRSQRSVVAVYVAVLGLRHEQQPDDEGHGGHHDR